MGDRASPPGPFSWSPLGDFIPFRRDPLGYLSRLRRQYGDLARFRLLNRSAYLFAHPDYVRDLLLQPAGYTTKSMALQRSKPLLGDGLLTSEPPLHTRQRRLIQPAFHRERLVRYGTIMTSTGDAWLRRWRDRRIEDAPVDLHSEMMQLTLSIVVQALFTADLTAVAQEISQITNLLIGMFPYLVLPFGEYIESWPLPVSRRFRAARGRLDSLIYGLIASRRRSANSADDLLSLLLAAQDDDSERGGGMSDRRVRDELVTLFIAGHETTANALTWTWYLLSQHPEVEIRFHEEIDQVLAGRQPDIHDLENLRYINAVLSESMRLYPPAWAISRIAVHGFEAGPYRIPPGALCIASQWVIHRDARFFPDPEQFRPERWLDELAARPRFAYFPFGGGSRICIGERFAWMEGALLLALLGQRWQFRMSSEATVTPQPLITLRPKLGLKVIAQPR
jgi:cytochrome P450